MRRTLDSFCFVLEKCSMGHETTPVPETPNERHRRVAHAFDETLQTNIERRTGGLSPIALSLAQMDWALHMLGSPAQQGVLAQRALELAVQAWDNLRTPPDTEVTEKDGRFADKGWNQWPYNVFKEGFKAYDSWWRDVADMPSGLNKHHQHMVNFFAGQALDAMSPSNWLLTNPEVLRVAQETQGTSLKKGWEFFLQDLREQLNARPDTPGEHLEPLEYAVGKDVAVTPGKVVFRP